jgi:DNA-3-methyladenine glycosylase
MAATQAMSELDFTKAAETLAPELLSCVLINEDCAGEIVETEAYLGLNDLAAHASRGRTKRTEVMFGKAGRAYVYFIYGMYECLNVVADREGVPGCVLIRAIRPICGIAKMRERRAWPGKVTALANGPGKLTRALAIDRAHYGVDMTSGSLCIRRWKTRPTFRVAVGPRVGIQHCADWPLRFTWAESEFLSR